MSAKYKGLRSLPVLTDCNLPVRNFKYYTNSLWYVQNDVIHADLKIPDITHIIPEYCKRFHGKTATHQNDAYTLINGQKIPLGDSNANGVEISENFYR